MATSRTDETYEDFLARESAGWVVVIIAREYGPKQNLFANVVGDKDGSPYADKRLATNHAARVRAAYKRELYAASSLAKVSVRPLWKDS